MPPNCRARLLSDLSGQTACDKEATSSDGRLCAFHSRQCQALYRGYKKRNAELDGMSDKLPTYLAIKKSSVAVQDFTDVEDEATLRSVHDYVFRRYNLLDRVIRARRLHHSHFFAIDNDYGHEKYLDRLQNERRIMVKALEKLGKRAASLMHQQKQWYGWVKKAQDEEEKNGESESNKVKLESLLFKRHQKELARHQREMRAREDKKRQDEYLNQVYEQRLSDMSEEEQDDWDPVQDVHGYEKDNYIDLIKFFLMIEDGAQSSEEASQSASTEHDDTPVSATAGKALSKSAKKRARKVNAEVKKMADPTLQTAEGRGSNVIEMETTQQMRDRLRQPVKFERSSGVYLAGNGPLGIDATTHVLPEDEVEQLLKEVAEIKNFLFCRLLLSQATLLPVALEADTIDDFLERTEVTREHLRDICLKLERPGLQDVRDACADFIRERDGVEENVEEDIVDVEDDHKTSQIPKKYSIGPRQRLHKYQTKREKAAENEKPPKLKGHDIEPGAVNFGKIVDEDKYSHKRMRVKVCGRYMYHYPSEKSLNRGGWYHFSVIAKDSDLFDAVELCRNWNEFFELNILCLHHFFPAPKWSRFVGDLPRQSLLQLGFIPYFNGENAERVTNYFQTGSRGMARRSHAITEMRNFMCGHIKRDDPVSRRFIQYLANETWEIRALVRDRKTGRILIQPPKDEMWLLREKSGWGRANKNDFNIIAEIGPDFFEKMDTARKWRFGFVEYYDVYIWDSDPGRSFFILQKKVEEILARAWRVRELRDMFSASRGILQTITRDPATLRVRSIKPGEEAVNMWDGLDKTAKAFVWSPDHPNNPHANGNEIFMKSYAYTEADEIEDALLFPYEATGEMADNLFRNDPSAMELFENRTLDIRKIAADPDTDDELSESDEEFDFDDDYSSEMDEEAVAALEADDGDPNWGTDDEFLDEDDEGGTFITAAEHDAIDEAVVKLAAQMKGFSLSGSDYFLSIVRNPASAEGIADVVKNDPANLMHALRNAFRCQKEFDTNNIEADFYRHMDRQKSKAFKKCWHETEAPDARKNYEISQILINVMDHFVMERSGMNAGPFELCKFMQMGSHFREERRIVDDAFKAYAAVSLFFDTDKFLASKLGSLFKDCELLDQGKRAKNMPNRRTHKSNKTMPKEFWKDWDKLLKDNKRTSDDAVDDIFPLEWRKAIRTVVIRLFRAGVICPSYSSSVNGVTTAQREPNRPMDLYLDYRVGIPSAEVVSHLKDPTPFDRDYLIRLIKTFSSSHPSAKFAVLRAWSSPYFYPLMLGYDRRPGCAFLDDRGRCWEFKFVPKDMPYSEWSIHLQLTLRLEPYRGILGLGREVVVAKDLVLVMGEDEERLRLLAGGVTWAVQTKPWRLEVDWWRSFVNVSGEFLEGLGRGWLD